MVALGPRPIQHPSGMDALCIVLEPDGEDRWAERRPVADHTRLGPGKLIALLRDAGRAVACHLAPASPTPAAVSAAA